MKKSKANRLEGLPEELEALLLACLREGRGDDYLRLVASVKAAFSSGQAEIFRQLKVRGIEPVLIQDAGRN